MNFTYKQVNTAFNKVKTDADFPKYVQELKAIGVQYYDRFVNDGHIRYFGDDTYVLEGDNKYPEIEVNNLGSAHKLKEAMYNYKHGRSNYEKFCELAADAGVEKWRADFKTMTITYYDKKGNALSVEAIPQV